MKKLLLCLCLVVAIPAILTGCSTAPSQRVATVQTLGAIGIAAKSSLDEAARLLAQKKITVAQWSRIAAFYDTAWQPAYRLAVQTVRSDLSSVASPDLLGLAAQFASLVAQLTSPSP